MAGLELTKTFTRTQVDASNPIQAAFTGLRWQAEIAADSCRPLLRFVRADA